MTLKELCNIFSTYPESHPFRKSLDNKFTSDGSLKRNLTPDNLIQINGSISEVLHSLKNSISDISDKKN